ncbi:hypothetical protein Y032_0111g232 [Ancylostoma ceylanicum]|uniref:Uncharacterized protein n=1 Tax=Ancylostoma ceylanicum TaxID=53326 RepID=A0A016TDF1_9BILA|nr:hypothetical protein Y032_0111g232 [Ancylostoma ceylanicum]
MRSRSRSSDRQSSRSRSSSSSEGSSSRSSCSPSPVRHRRQQSDSDHTDDHGEAVNDAVAVPGTEYKSPLASQQRIPRKDEFKMAQEEVPAPPAVPQRTQRIRVTLPPEARQRFDQLAAGMQISASEKIAMLKDLPLVSSPFAEVALLDDQLPKEVERSIQIRETDLRSLNETLINTLNIIELIRKLGSDGSGADFHPSVVGYMEIANTLLSSSLREVIVLRRERVLRSLGLDPYRAMPSYKRLPLAGTTVVHRMSQAVHPELFGRDLRDELASGESALLKSVQKLRAQRSRKRDRPEPKRRRPHSQSRSDRADMPSTSQREKSRDKLKIKRSFKPDKKKENEPYRLDLQHLRAF